MKKTIIILTGFFNGFAITNASSRNQGLLIKVMGVFLALIIFSGINTPVRAEMETPGFIAIAAGLYHTVALKADGAVIAWGYNGWGQTNVPAEATADVIAIAAGGDHTVALKTNGSVIAWGRDLYGQTSVPDCLLAFDYDDDGSCYAPLDNCPSVANSDQLNSDSDSLGDACDNCPEMENENQPDWEGDNIGDVCDLDDDNDMVPDVAEVYLGTDPLVVDSDGDGANDHIDPLPLDDNYSLDADSNGIPDEVENELDALTTSNAYLNVGDQDEDGDVDGDDLKNFSMYFGNDAIDIDNDGDTFAEIEGDCDDLNSDVNPQAMEICNDSMDNDCDGDVDGADSDCS